MKNTSNKCSNKWQKNNKNYQDLLINSLEKVLLIKINSSFSNKKLIKKDVKVWLTNKK